MKKIIFILLVAIHLNSFAQSGFRGYEWGTSREFIEQEIGLPTHAHPRGEPKCYLDSLMDKEVFVRFSFDEGLTGGAYIFASYAPFETLDFFRRVEKVLADKYGYKSDNFINDSELGTLMNKKEDYSLEFNNNVYLRFTSTTLYHPRKDYVVYVVFRKPEDYSYSKEDAEKL